MTRLGLFLWFCAASAVAFGLFQLKDKVAGLEDELRAERRVIEKHREAIQILQAEWSYLNRPDRIADLAERYLSLQPVTSDHIVTLESLALHLAPAEEAGETATTEPAPGQPTQTPTYASARPVP